MIGFGLFVLVVLAIVVLGILGLSENILRK